MENVYRVKRRCFRDLRALVARLEQEPGREHLGMASAQDNEKE